MGDEPGLHHRRRRVEHDELRLHQLLVRQAPRARVISLSVADLTISSGSFDGWIVHHDRRAPGTSARSKVHKGAVCGLRWNAGRNLLASGGNDDRVMVWDARGLSSPMGARDHGAAVKALAWSPWQAAVLATGGGEGDKSIRTWDARTLELLGMVSSGAQVCAVEWSRHTRELISAFGYHEATEQLVVWAYPELHRRIGVSCHCSRVLHMDVSADGRTLVAACNDETLRFWDMFAPPRSARDRGAASPLTSWSAVR